MDALFPFGDENVLLRARARTHFVKDFPGPLSIKSVVEGTVAWRCEGRDLVVNRDSFLVLNDREPYSMEIDSRRPVETLCIFFQRGFVESAAQREIDPEPPPPLFFGRLHLAGDRILPRMRDLRPGSRLAIDEQCCGLARELLRLSREACRRMANLPGSRLATREELYRRVRRGQEFLHANFAADCNLAELARESCLSPYHFHRAFAQAFGKTPHQYRTALRLAQARRLIETTELTITEICGAVGFGSTASFSALFRKAFGRPPSAFKKGQWQLISTSAGS